MKEILRLENVWVQSRGLTVLEDINLTVYSSDFLGIIGPNGGGKTTLLKAILGLVKPTRGRIVVCGQKPKMKRMRMGYVPQSAGFDRDFPISVWDVVLTGRLAEVGPARRYSDRDRDIAEDALKQVGMSGLKDRQIGRLSGGQVQRVLIARALASEPEMLFLDEPTTGIDTRGETSIFHLLKELNSAIPIILVSHDIGVISSYVNKVACLNRRLYYHQDREITKDMLEAAYNCPVELIAHGLPHRILQTH